MWFSSAKLLEGGGGVTRVTPSSLLQCFFSYAKTRQCGFLSSHEGGLLHEQLFKLVCLGVDDQ
jgi:hypothetical protein